MEYLETAVTYFIDHRSGDCSLVPRSPETPWEGELRSEKMSYTGEILEVASPLTFDEVEPALPPPGFGGIVKLLDVVSPEIAWVILNPCLMFATS